MSYRIQSLAIAALLFAIATSTQAAEPVMRFMSIPKTLTSASSGRGACSATCYVGAEAKVRFSASGGDSETCTYRNNGTNFEFSGCQNENLDPTNVLVGQAVKLESTSYTYRVAYPVFWYVPYYVMSWYYTVLYGRRIQMPYYELVWRPFFYYDYQNITVPGCPGDGGASLATEVAKIYGPGKVACGAVTDQHTSLLGDLNCPDATFAGFQVSAKDKHLDGRKHAIVAKNASLALFVMGEGLTVERLTVINRGDKTAVQAYNTPRLTFQNNKIKGNGIGLNVYSDSIAPDRVLIKNNDMSGNAIGVKFNGEGANRAVNPALLGNDFSGASVYSLWLDVVSASLRGKDANVFNDAANGVMFLGATSAAISGVDFSKARIRGRQVSFVNTAEAYALDSDLSYSLDPTGAGDHIAIDAYRVGVLHVRNVKASGGDVSIKLTTDSGVTSSAYVDNSTLTQNSTAGVMVQSFDGTAFSNLSVMSSDLRGNPAGMGVWFVPGTGRPGYLVLTGNKL